MTTRVLAPLLLLAVACGKDTDPVPEGPPGPDDHARYIDCAVDLAVDELDDGAIDWTQHLEYDAFGFVTWQEQDLDADGTVDVERSYLNDRFGNALETRYDGNADGFADSVSRGEYDADGNPLRFEIDSGADGTLDTVYTYTVVDGLLRSGEMADGAGDIWYEYSWEYDALGREILATTFDVFSDVVLREETTSWHGDSDVATGTTWTEYDLVGGVFRSVTWQVELDQQLRAIGYHMVDEVMGEPNGTIDRTYTYEGAFQEPSAKDEEQTAGGEPWLTGSESWRYDAGRRVTEDLYVGETVDGTDVTRRVTYAWSCPTAMEEE